MSKTWFITGTSRGLGREWAETALERGDNVAATARNIESLAPLVKRYGDLVLPIQLDVSNKTGVDAAIVQTHQHFGHLDVVVNNAGYGLFGTIEEVSEEEARAQFETNVFGSLWVIKAALPIMRGQGSGHIIQVSSIGGIIAPPAVGLYNATKWGMEGLTQTLAAEVQPFGIKVTIIEPVIYNTDWVGSSAIHANSIAAYDDSRAARDSMTLNSSVSGDPKATRTAILAVVDAENPPLRIFFGQGGLSFARAEYQQRLKTWEEWDDVAKNAHGTPRDMERLLALINSISGQ